LGPEALQAPRRSARPRPPLSAVPGKLRFVDWWAAIWTGLVIGLVVAAVVAGIHWYLERRETKARETGTVCWSSKPADRNGRLAAPRTYRSESPRVSRVRLRIGSRTTTASRRHSKRSESRTPGARPCSQGWPRHLAERATVPRCPARGPHRAGPTYEEPRWEDLRKRYRVGFARVGPHFAAEETGPRFSPQAASAALGNPQSSASSRKGMGRLASSSSRRPCSPRRLGSAPSLQCRPGRRLGVERVASQLEADLPLSHTGRIPGRSRSFVNLQGNKAPRFGGAFRCSWRNGAAPESNRPSLGLPDRTGFEGLRRAVRLATGAAFWARFRTPRCGRVR
jgi:hypothetical protein